MASDGMNTLLDAGMLDLFRMEAEMHTAALETGLVELEGQPEAMEKIEPLMRAAHSIKGAARIVGLDTAVGLAHAMEDLLVAAQEKKVVLGPASIDCLLQAVDLLRRLSALKAQELASWLTSQEAGIADLVERLSRFRSGTFAEQGSGSLLPEAPPPSFSPPTRAKPETSDLIDPSMLDLFRMEAEMHAAALETGLVELEGQPEAMEKIEPLMRAAHSIKGAARIVGLDIAVGLAHAMEDLLVAAQERKVVLGPASIDMLLRGADVFKRLCHLEAGQLTSWLAGNEGEIGSIGAGLTGLVSGKPVPHTSPHRDPLPEGEGASAAPADSKALPVSSAGPKAIASGPESLKTLPSPKKSPPEPTSAKSESDNAVLVTAENLSRLMGLAGECLVESQSLRAHVLELYQLKSHLSDLHKTIESLKTGSGFGIADPSIRDMAGEAMRQAGKCRDILARQTESLETYTLRWENLSNRLYNQAIATRMRPFRDGAHGFPRLVRDTARALGKKVKLKITGNHTKVDRDILGKLEAPLTHILRNACDHGLETPEERLAAGKPEEGTIELRVTHRAGMFLVTISDDGRGIDREKIRSKIVARGVVSQEMAGNLSEAELMDFLFLSGFSTAPSVTELSGRGVGLDVVKTMIQEVRGTVSVQSTPGLGTTFHLELPLTLSVIRALLVEISGEPYAFPLMRLDRVLKVSQESLQLIEDRQYLAYQKENIGLVAASQPLDLKPAGPVGNELAVIVISDRLNRYGVVVDRLLGEVEMVVRPLDPCLGKVPNISAAAVSEDGSPILIVDVDDLVRSIDNSLTGGRIARVDRIGSHGHTAKARRILVVDDSITVREVERRLLENKGYAVEVAVDGMDGWNAVRAASYDLVISDVDMPRMNGIEMVRSIRSDLATKDVPVIILSYKDREEDRLLGLEAGANCYLTKSSFYDESFINSVTDLIGEP